jgi:hypothetical protein
VVARAIQIEGGPAGIDSNPVDVTGRIRDGVAAVASKILGAGAGWVTDVLGWNPGAEAKLALSKLLARRRRELTLKALPVPGDVLYYQRLGSSIRKHVRDEVRDLERPIVALGHSLGAIVLVDALFGRDREELGVAELVTFGAQSPMLKVIGAIDDVQPPENIKWLNIWTRYDFISFLAGGIWPAATDVSVAIDVGFPDAHGAYYETPAFYDHIRALPMVSQILSGNG